MSWFSEPKHTTCRKPRVCSWCGKWIEVGDRKVSYLWVDGGDKGFENMHAECYAASQTMSNDDLESLAGIQFSRGCTCDAGQCECLCGPVEKSEVSK